MQWFSKWFKSLKQLCFLPLLISILIMTYKNVKYVKTWAIIFPQSCSLAFCFIWDKAFKSRLSKFCGRQSLKRFKGYGLLKNLKFFRGRLPQSLPTPFLNTLFYMIIIFPGNSKLYLVEPSVVLLKSLLKINNNLSDIITVLQRPLVQSK